jgi:hypothetical protein
MPASPEGAGPYTRAVTLLPTDSGPFAAHLLPGEEILWTGRPDPRRVFTASDWFVIPFSLVWAGGAFFWEGAVISGLASSPSSKYAVVPWVFALFGLPFVLMGLYLIVGRFVHRAWAHRRTWYALTNKRALVAYGPAGQHGRSVTLGDVKDISADRRTDGSGTITFGQADRATTIVGAMPRSSFLGAPGWMGIRQGPLTFTNIPDVAAVESLATSFAQDLR